MTITFTLPLVGNKPTTSKDLVLSILAEKHPLSLIELQRAMHKQYGKLVSFQSVRQAVLELEEAHVLERSGKHFSLSRTWIRELLLFGNKLQHRYLTASAEGSLAVGPNVTVYTLSKMIEVDAIWNDLINEIYADPAQPKSMTFIGVHFWFLLATLAQETALIKNAIARGVAPHFLCYGDTPIDAWSVRYYQSIGAACMFAKRPDDFNIGFSIGAFGDCIIQIQYPSELSEKLEAFYTKYSRIEDAKLDEIVAITSQEGAYQLTVIKDPVLARNFRENVIAQFSSNANTASPKILK